MTAVTIDSELLLRLNGLTEQTEFRDEAGRVLGHFTPVKGAVELLPSDRCPYTAKELQQMRNERGGRSLADILQELGGQ